MKKNNVLLFRTLQGGIPNCCKDQCRKKIVLSKMKKTKEAISKRTLRVRIRQAIIAHGRQGLIFFQGYRRLFWYSIA